MEQPKSISVGGGGRSLGCFAPFLRTTCFDKCLRSFEWLFQIFYTWHLYPFLHIYEHLSMPCLAVIFVSANAYELSSDVTNIIHLATIFVLSHLWSLTYVFILQTFFLIYDYNFLSCTHVYLHTMLLPIQCRMIVKTILHLTCIFVLSH